MPVQAADAAGLVRHQPIQSRAQLCKVSALASTFLLSVVLGNVALRFIPVSFAQVHPSARSAATCCLLTAKPAGQLPNPFMGSVLWLRWCRHQADPCRVTGLHLAFKDGIDTMAICAFSGNGQ